jgi:hypothetical protein
VIAMLAAVALLGAPVVVHDAQERSPLASVGARPGTFAREPVVYRRVADGWVQYWMVFERNDQDRGVLRTGRHAGDWEMVQVRLDGSEAVFAQHSGAERCRAGAVETRGGRFVVYVANGSHAAYFHPGVRDRMWPDPNDEADGRGEVVVPAVEPLGAWARWPGRWGRRAGRLGAGRDGLAARAAVPAQGRWSDPDAWAAAARPCTYARCDEAGECDGRETAIAFAAPVALALAAIAVLRRRSSRHVEHREP